MVSDAVYGQVFLEAKVLYKNMVAAVSASFPRQNNGQKQAENAIIIDTLNRRIRLKSRRHPAVHPGENQKKTVDIYSRIRYDRTKLERLFVIGRGAAFWRER